MTQPPKPFLPALESLMERATKGPWRVYAVGTTTQIGAADNPGARPCVVGWPGFDSTDLPLKKNRANAELIAYLVNHAPAIAAVVRAAEVMLDHAPPVVVSGREGTNYYANDVLRQALATLNGEAKP